MALHDLKAGRRKRRLLGDPRDSQGGRGVGCVSLKQADRLREGQSPSRAQLLRPRAERGPHIPEHPPAWQC